MISVRFGMISSSVQNFADTDTRRDLRVVQIGELPVEPVVGVALAAERLDHPHAERGLLDMGGDVAGLVLRQPRQPRVLPLEVQHRQR